ncbi:phage holin family protein [Aequorivita marina]|uniref:phage holin family protein n=1 Tax=Aequorivita marina TaxID=3073654 RepID=UPI002876ED89|nr:phage holin family protein [Aequorivita sp. S2608]MDS1299714.1 phage holin family protein [Aequorivita sp. S2608]
MFKNLTDSLQQIVDRFEDYGISTAEYYRLRLFKSAMKGSISLVNLLVFGSLSLFVMLFLSVGAAFWLGTYFEHSYVGFFLVGAFYGILLIFMYVFGKKLIERGMLRKFSKFLFDEDDDEPKDVAEKEVEEFRKVIKK